MLQYTTYINSSTGQTWQVAVADDGMEYATHITKPKTDFLKEAREVLEYQRRK